MKKLILDTETTGLDDNAEIIQIGIVDAESGNVLMNEKIFPLFETWRIGWPSAQKIHGISPASLQGCRTFPIVYDDIREITEGCELFIYNSSYDLRIIRQTADKYNISGRLGYNSVECVMHAYAEFYGEWDDYRDCFRWQKLINAARQQELDLSGVQLHDAVGDCLVTRLIMQKIGMV